MRSFHAPRSMVFSSSSFHVSRGGRLPYSRPERASSCEPGGGAAGTGSGASFVSQPLASPSPAGFLGFLPPLPGFFSGFAEGVDMKRSGHSFTWRQKPPKTQATKPAYM
jgi:hypothetical protein